MTSIYILVTLNKLSMEPKYFAFGGNWTPLHHFLTFGDGEPGFLGILNFNLQIVIPTSQTSEQKTLQFHAQTNLTNLSYSGTPSNQPTSHDEQKKTQQNREDSKRRPQQVSRPKGT